MLPPQYVTCWFRFGPRVQPLSYQATATKLWFEVTTGDFTAWNFPDRSLFCQLFTNYLLGIFNPAMTSDFGMFGNNVEIVTPGFHNSFFIPAGSHGTGPAGYDSPALSCCFLKRTSKIGRSGLGRLFLSGVPRAWLSNNSITPAAMAIYQNFADQMKVDYVFPFIPYVTITLSPRLYSFQDDDLTVIDHWVPKGQPTYLYRRRFRR